MLVTLFISTHQLALNPLLIQAIMRSTLNLNNCPSPAPRVVLRAPSNTPTRTCVAGGRMTGQMIRAIVQRSGSNLPVSLSSYAVVGAAAFMGGATRLTLTATVMVMETTGSLQLIVPLMLTVFVAKVSICQQP